MYSTTKYYILSNDNEVDDLVTLTVTFDLHF